MSENPWEGNYEVINKEVQERLLQLAKLLQSECPEGWGFALQMFEFKGKAFFYISNADRKDMIMALKEFIRKEEAN